MEQWLERHGKWLLLSGNDLERTQEWFKRHGTWAVLLGRVMPGVRSFISVPAGLSEMNVGSFLVLTALGSAAWNVVLAGAGYFLGQDWEQVLAFLDPISPIIYAAVAVAAAFFIGKRLLVKRHEGKEKSQPTEGERKGPWFPR